MHAVQNIINLEIDQYILYFDFNIWSKPDASENRTVESNLKPSHLLFKGKNINKSTCVHSNRIVLLSMTTC
ncbi:hypothetical protein DERP_010506 [Dermatophagoides pteronyssinus]|uniref:Uncharacterized protein n=1 Tax=Dermatophagoides pteronyssinus TaxID=6956 RepID=A0ABQ8JFH7_DERPT|nr:hypothetical protein DERP_010506 [Dermatophagoides pteronyssinus]